jgi:hypothetical protein
MGESHAVSFLDFPFFWQSQQEAAHAHGILPVSRAMPKFQREIITNLAEYTSLRNMKHSGKTAS